VRLFKWSKRHAVFIPEIDAEHRNIFRLADELHQAVVGSAPTDQARALLRELVAKSEDHFAREERLMRATHYPGSAWHKKRHDTVRKRVKEFAPRIEGGDGQAALLLLEFLSGWLRDHVRVADCMMAAHVRNYERNRAALAS
jgi:methyl-accepting chemotaxis protein/hemerythrin